MGCASSTEREREGQGNARGEASSSAKQQPPVSSDAISLTVQANGSGDKSSLDTKGGSSNGAAGGKQQQKVETALSTSESVQRALLQVGWGGLGGYGVVGVGGGAGFEGRPRHPMTRMRGPGYLPATCLALICG